MPLFSVPEARAFLVGDRAPLADEDAYPDAAIEAAEAGIAQAFADICGVAFVPTTETIVMDGVRGHGPLILPRRKVTAVTAADYRYRGTASWTALTTDELAALEVDDWRLDWPGGWWQGNERGVRLTITHGFAEVPWDIKDAALRVCVRKLVGDQIGDRVLSMSNGAGQVERFAVAGGSLGGRQIFFGLPEVSETLHRYRDKYLGPGVG